MMPGEVALYNFESISIYGTIAIGETPTLNNFLITSQLQENSSDLAIT